MNKVNRRQLFGTLAAGALSVRSLAAGQGVILSELDKPVDLAGLRKKYHAGDPVDLNALRGARWSPDRAFKYMQKFGVVKGVNYSTRVGGVFSNFNERVMQELFGSGVRPRIEFPLAEFNEQIIAQELGWAQNVVGLNSLRIFLNVQALDQAKFYTHFERLLEIAASKGMTITPVTGVQGVRDPATLKPTADPQFEFKPGVVFGGFRGTGGGGAGRWDDEWPKNKKFMKDALQAFISRYAKDERIIFWDLANEPATALRPLVEYVFKWAREVNPSQPLSVCWNAHDLSDVITFHTYMRPGLSAPQAAPARVDFLTELEWARAWKRPMLCTEWLARPFKSTIENTLPFFSRYNIGWYSFALVTGGPSQYQYPWNWPIGSPPPKEWFHGLLYPDGTPYSAEEILAIRDFKYQPPPPFVKTQSYWAYGDSDVRDVAPPID